MAATRIARAVLPIALVLAACADDDPEPAASTDETTTSTSVERADPVEPEAFEGSVDDFYVVPDPLPPGAPGDLIRTMPIDAPEGMVGYRVMYRSTDAEGDDRAATGTVHLPDGPTAEPPVDGWPILAWAHGTSGLASPCAPSRSGGAPPAFGVRGVLVAPDYIGLGPVGELHPYLSRAAEGHAMVDGVAAARQLPDANAGDRWVAVGVSQGGHAALVTNELASERLPEVELLGSVAVAPGAELGRTFGDDIQTRVITTLVLAGVAAEDPSVDLADYLSPAAAEAASVIEEACIVEIATTMGALALEPGYFTVDPRTSPVGEAWLAENDPGRVAADSPVLLVQGGQDTLVLPERTAALLERLCGLGQVVETLDVPEGTHDSVTGLAAPQIEAWLAERLAGVPVGDDC